MKKKDLAFATKIIHKGSEPDPSTGAIMPPIFQTSTYVQSAPGEHKGFEYTRSHNPTRSRLEECLAAAENAKFALTTSSGLAAESLVLHSLPIHSRILSSDDVYGGTYRLFANVFNHHHEFKYGNSSDFNSFSELAKKFKPHLIWIESITNPMLKISDIKNISKLAKSIGALLLVDNTFASPALFNPIDLGADYVLHSTTKYINGHSDVVGGVLMLNDQELYQKLFYLQNAMGPCASPFDSWLILRGIKTLDLRMKAHSQNGLQIAEFLSKHPHVEKVIYPGLKNHPQHSLAKTQFKDFGGIITFYLKGNMTQTKKFLKKLKLFALAESLGGVESLVDHPAAMTHASIPKKTRIEIGITDNLLRLSVGIEDAQDLISDLNQALL